MKSQRKESSEAMNKTMLLPRLMLPGSCDVNRPSNGTFAWHIGLLGKGDWEHLSFGALTEKRKGGGFPAELPLFS